MKKVFFFLGILLLASLAYFACKKPATVEKVSLNEQSRALLANCDYVTLTGVLSDTRTTLDADTVYKLNGVVTFSSGNLTVQAGTKVLGMKSANPSFLVIKKTATISAVGTSTNPIIFTSDQSATNRAPADWGGILIEGEALNNQSNSLGIVINSTTHTAGGNSDADNAGTLQYVQIHYAGNGGGTGSNERSEAALILNSVGSGTTIDHIQISNSGKDGISVWGGKPKLEHIFVQDVQRNDYRFSYGSIGQGQFLGAIKRQYVSSPAATASMEISNVLGIGGESETATRQTYPVFSNVTLMGGDYCASGDADIDYGILFTRNGTAKVYNTVITAFDDYGLYLSGNNVVANTDGASPLEFSYNSFTNNTTTYGFVAASGWVGAGGCSSDMLDWITGPTSTCEETGNQFTVATLDYNSSFCGTYCTNFTPNFILGGSTTLSAANFGWDGGNLFSHPAYRGAYETSTSWVTNNWANLCPQNVVYCDN